jgi:CubicO group peptidase (beta-lactamase class C family)
VWSNVTRIASRLFDDPLFLLTQAPIPGIARCRIPEDTESVTSVGDEDPGASDVPADHVLRVWRRIEALYRAGLHPALQVCIRRQGEVVLHRCIGHARGNEPGATSESGKVVATTETPFDIFSASKAITAMLIHKLDDEGVLHLEDRVCEFIPEFARHGKDRITIRHLLTHRAGIPNLPPDAIDLDLLSKPERVVEILCDARPRTRPGQLLAYHAVTGGFVLGEVVRRATGEDIRTALVKRVCDPLGFRWMRYGVAAEDLPLVARDTITGPPVPPPISNLLRNALGVSLKEVVDLANDPRFLTGIIPSANIVTTAEELCAFYQCLLDEGELSGVRVFAARTVRRATAEITYLGIDFTLGLPLRYGLGFMLGSEYASLFGWDSPTAFGHVGFTNSFSWADPERRLSVALLTNGKPVLSLHAIRLVQLMGEMNRAFPKLTSRNGGSS